MRSYFFQTPLWLQWAYSELVWSVPTDEKVLFLTFDDGPVADATPYVLEELSRYRAKATFFCIGKNIQRNPEILQEVITNGHQVGNHSFSHPNGWKTADNEYLQDITRCDEHLQAHGIRTNLLRPPYGRISKTQINALKSTYRLVMWSHLSGDFDHLLDIRSSLKHLRSAREGSILVFHDSASALKNLKQILPVVLDHFSTLGFTFKSLSNDTVS